MKDLINEMLETYIEKRVKQERSKFIEKLLEHLHSKPWHDDYKKETFKLLEQLINEVNENEN